MPNQGDMLIPWGVIWKLSIKPKIQENLQRSVSLVHGPWKNLSIKLNSSIATYLGVRWDSVTFNFWWTKTGSGRVGERWNLGLDVWNHLGYLAIIAGKHPLKQTDGTQKWWSDDDFQVPCILVYIRGLLFYNDYIYIYCFKDVLLF